MKKKTMEDRFLWNAKIMSVISDIMIKHRDLRFNQILYGLRIVNNTDDTFYDEPSVVYKRIQNTLREVKKK